VNWRALPVLFGCACAHVGPTPSSGPETADYWPLKAGAVFRYEVTDGNGKSEQRVRFSAAEGGGVHDNRGQRFRHDADGLFDGARYLLRRPLVVGAEWMGVPEPGVVERFRIVRVDVACPPPHTMLSRCMAVEARQRIDARTTLLSRWWYARGLGPVRIDTSVQRPSGAIEVQQSMVRKLRRKRVKRVD
jgi:hypothetical protein